MAVELRDQRKQLRLSLQKKEEVQTCYAMLYNEEREKAMKAKNYVPVGTLKRYKKRKKAGLKSNSISLENIISNSISLETIRSRVKRHNLSAYNPFETLLINNIEAIIFYFCIRLGKTSKPLTKRTVIEFSGGTRFF